MASMKGDIWDLLQAASNIASGSVTGNVDAAAWVLRKAGLPIPPNAMGTSKWAEEIGLTRPVKEGLPKMAGESLGLLSPIVASARAPQIAAGLLSAGDNLAAPAAAGMNRGQRGAIVLSQEAGGVTDAAKKLADELEQLAEQHGTLYVRWSPSLRGDLQPGRVSRDFVAGSSHGGLSAVPITADMHQVDILKRVNEYNFLGRNHKPHIYKAKQVGTDSDGYASISELQPIREFSDAEVAGLRGGMATVLDLADNVEKAKKQIAKFSGGSPYWEAELKKASTALKEAEDAATSRILKFGNPQGLLGP